MKLKKHQHLIRIPYSDPMWLEYKKSGIGGSEVGTLLGLNDSMYECSAKIFHEKVGLFDFSKQDNEAMFWGREHEENIAQKWQYFDGNGYMENFMTGRKLRSCSKVNGFVTNDNFPYMFASPDRVMDKADRFSLITGESLSNIGVLEVKTAMKYAAEKWEAKVPPKYVAQVHQYMMILETDYAEVCMLIDGRYLKVFPIERSQVICDEIQMRVIRFWEDHIIPAQALMEQYNDHLLNGKVADANAVKAEILSYEPDPEEGEAYRNLMADIYAKEWEVVQGKPEFYDMGVRYKWYGELIKGITAKQSLVKNQIIHEFVTAGSEKMDYGEDGYMRYFVKKGNDKPGFDNRLKVEFKEEEIEKIVAGLK